MSEAAQPPELPAVLEIQGSEGAGRAGSTLRNTGDLPLIARLESASPSVRVVPRACGLAAGEQVRVVAEAAAGKEMPPGATVSVAWRQGAGGAEQRREIPLELALSQRGAAEAPSGASVPSLFEAARSVSEDVWSLRDGDDRRASRRQLRRLPAEAVRRERATALLALADPAVTRLRAWLEAEDGLYLVTDRPSGEPIAEWASRTREDMTPSSLADLGWQLTVAVALLHAAGVPHGALSPASVFRTSDGRLQLAGFTLDPDATETEDVQDVARLLLALVPPGAWWAVDAAAAFRDVDTVASLYSAMKRLGQASAASPAVGAWGSAPADTWRASGVLDTLAAPDGADDSPLPYAQPVFASPQATSGADPFSTGDVVIGTHQTAEAEASPELDLDTTIGHVLIEMEREPGLMGVLPPQPRNAAGAASLNPTAASPEPPVAPAPRAAAPAPREGRPRGGGGDAGSSSGSGREVDVRAPGSARGARVEDEAAPAVKPQVPREARSRRSEGGAPVERTGVARRAARPAPPWGLALLAVPLLAGGAWLLRKQTRQRWEGPPSGRETAGGSAANERDAPGGSRQDA